MMFPLLLLIIFPTVVGSDSPSGGTYDIDEESRYPTPYANTSWLPRLLTSLSKQKHTPITTKQIKGTYDYVVVGSGAGGSTVAARLSEMPCANILVLEAGKSSPMLTEVPGLYFSFLGSDIDWNYSTESQEYAAFAHVDQKVVWPSGKAVGGGTIINAMFNVRGNMDDYNMWAEMGAEGWNYTDVLPYFRKLEQNIDYGRTYYHGDSGPITVEKLRFNPKLKQAVSQAAIELGYSFVDSNGAEQTGFFDIQCTTRNAQRCSAAKGYLVPAEDRPNLDIVSNAFVTKVVVEDGQATGVEFDFEGEHRSVTVRREVIVSAGAVKSAQLLMLSGIGPKEHLLEMGIPVIADLPVGKNFYDHLSTFLTFEVDEDEFQVDLVDPSIVDEYISHRTGPLSSVPISHIAFLRNKSYQGLDRRPDHQIFISGVFRTSAPANLKPEVLEFMYGPYINKTNFICAVHSSHPKSSGYVKLKSTDPYDEPIINPEYLKEPEDVRDTVEGLKVCLTLANTRPLQKIGAKVFDYLPPSCEPLDGDLDAALECLTRSIGSSLSHPTGTARMGQVDDPTTVVDTQLRVKSIERLRVVDASVFPSLTSGNTNVPTIMVAEKASDIIKRDINCGS